MYRNISFTILQTLPYFTKFPQTPSTDNFSTDLSLKKIDLAYKMTTKFVCVLVYPLCLGHLTIFHTIFNL